MPLSDAWDTTGGPSRSLQKRAAKRTVRPADIDNAWVVDGMESLGDTYPFYEITWNDGELWCSCSSHGYGEYRRRTCSHRLAVELWMRDNDWTPGTVEDALVSDPPVAGGAPGSTLSPPRHTDSGGGSPIPTPSASLLPDDIPAVDDPMWGDPPLPDKFQQIRDQQWEAVTQIVEHLNDGKKVVFLSAPTGAGKTLIAELVRRIHNPHAPTSYMCTTRSLQRQFLHDFTYARLMEGRSNYPTADQPDKFPDGTLTAAECTMKRVSGPQCDRCPDFGNPDTFWRDTHETTTYQHCYWCHPVTSCPYRKAKTIASNADLSVLNLAYYLAETQAPISAFSDHTFNIIDEADMLERVMTGHGELRVTAWRRRQLGVHNLPKKTVEKDWVRWLEGEVGPAVRRRLAHLRHGDPDDPKKIREINGLADMSEQIDKLLLLVDDDGTTVLEKYYVMDWDRNDYSQATLQFKPIKIDHAARRMLWETAGQWLIMSASFVGVAQVAKDLGLRDDEWAVVEVDSTFPVENRPIIVARDVDMSFKNKDQGWPALVKNMQELLDEHPGERVLVHTVSYQLADYLMDNLEPGRTMTYHSAKERDRVLEQFRETDDGVILAPSFDRGIDLPHDECRLVIVAKMPYPYLKDKMVAKRMYLPGGRVWYTVETLRTLVQMTGRGVRSADDWAETWILDSQFRRLWRQWERIFPRWWREAVILSLTHPRYQDRLLKIRTRRHLWKNGGQRSRYQRRPRKEVNG